MSAANDAYIAAAEPRDQHIAELKNELREARSEIARHRDLIEDLCDGLFWALEYLGSDYPCHEGVMSLNPRGYYERLRELLNREVG